MIKNSSRIVLSILWLVLSQYMSLDTAKAAPLSSIIEPIEATNNYSFSVSFDNQIGYSTDLSIPFPFFDNSRGTLMKVDYSTSGDTLLSGNWSVPVLSAGFYPSTFEITTLHDFSKLYGPTNQSSGVNTFSYNCISEDPGICSAGRFPVDINDAYHESQTWYPNANRFNSEINGDLNFSISTSFTSNTGQSLVGNFRYDGLSNVVYTYDSRTKESYAREILNVVKSEELSDSEAKKRFYEYVIQNRQRDERTPGISTASSVNKNLTELEYFGRGVDGGSRIHNLAFKGQNPFDPSTPIKLSELLSSNDLANMLSPIAAPAYSAIKLAGEVVGFSTQANKLPSSQTGTGLIDNPIGWQLGAAGFSLETSLDLYLKGDSAVREALQNITNSPGGNDQTIPKKPDLRLDLSSLITTDQNTSVVANVFLVDNQQSDNLTYFDPLIQKNYVVSANGFGIKSFLIPLGSETKPGSFTLDFYNFAGDLLTFDLDEGSLFSFEDYLSGGITSFLITNYSTEASEFIVGLNFTNRGIGQVTIFEIDNIAVIPEPNSLTMLIFGILILFAKFKFNSRLYLPGFRRKDV